MARVNAIKAAAPRRLDDPRTAVMPISLKKATSQAPSLLVLIKAETGRRKYRLAIQGGHQQLVVPEQQHVRTFGVIDLLDVAAEPQGRQP